ncbi:MULTISPECIES: ABC transporter substrate-binding protein [Paenibacillus]|uniref:Sugar ABC transporter substrate-binding protein n=1 Tax=Paenibacillus alvei TaxID=44250 RepID=A0ABT4E6L2_PAEAL|nr:MULTISPECIES: sugar ABC transporter substrate-binding protein [Paenibacillus]EPY14154.1 sugar ABC transporter periplasmic protein [Paenibacillus alvei A6-6i-x]MCY9529351.1 sugar ABC transporter substrate-binding protein [Paenibacillus alvei]SDF86468.1 putative chitobiose transport system substrate-binding protein [Paenibacillus sp. cl6col]
MSFKGRKLISLLLASMMMVGLLAACGSDSSSNKGAASSGNNDGEKPAEQVTVEFWTISLQPTFNDYFNKLIADYEAKNPNVKIDWKDYPYDAVLNKLMTNIAGGNAPDVVNLNTELANQMGTKDALVDFNQELTADQKAAYFQGIYSSTEMNGKAFALPWYTGLPVLFMNKDLVVKAGLNPDNPPKTKQELNEWGRQIKEKTGAYGYIFTMEARTLLEENLPFLTEDYKKAAFNTPEVEAYVNENVQLLKDGVIPKDIINYDKQVQYFASEQVAMSLSSSPFINKIKTAAPDVYNKMLAVPSPVGKAGIRYSNTMNIVVPSATSHKKEAVDFAVFVTNAANQVEFSKIANTLPSTVESAKDPFFSENDGTLEGVAKTVSAVSLDKAEDFYIGVESAKDVNQTITKALQDIYLNGTDVKKTLTTAESDVNKILGN